MTGRALRRLLAWLKARLARLGHLLLVFLEIIGLRRERTDHERQLARFRLCYTEFRSLLAANHSFLETLASVEQRLDGDTLVDQAYVKRTMLRAVADVHLMERCLGSISDGRYPAVRTALDGITAAITAELEGPRAAPSEDLVLDLEALAARDAAVAGGKMANLGEVRNHVGLPTPDGFAITTAAWRQVAEAAGLPALVDRELLALRGADQIEAVSERLRAAILGAPVPEALRAAVAQALDRHVARGVGPRRFAVRSSAPDEDGARSFAGQYETELDVPPDEVLPAVLRVFASLHAPGPMHYRLLHGIAGEAAEMAVGVITMVDALASGVAFTRDPARPGDGHVLVHAVAGLGVALVDGSTSPDEWRVAARDNPPVIVGRPDTAGAPTLTDAEVVELARRALVLEAHFGGPQDIEWALDRRRRLVILQSRPLALGQEEAHADTPVPGHAVLIEGAPIACPGVGVGPVVHLEDDGDLDGFPPGAVLVTRRPSPRFVRLMARAVAIVADRGGTTGHMASLAREMRVPTLLGASGATDLLLPGQVVTVDARSGRVYAGEVPALCGGEEEVRRARLRRRRRESPVFRLLERVAAHVVPLRLTDPRSSEFVAARCTTLHDVARYVHEKSYEEMFGMGERLGDFRGSSHLLDVFLPIDLYVIDLGGGLTGGHRGRKVKRDQVTSAPLAALLDGMLNEKIPRFGPRPLDVGGLLQIMARHALESPEEQRTFRDPCYAIVSDRYLNYTARVGYHFSVVDTYCGRTANKNYISFRFKGGAADDRRRARRAAAIAAILREEGFAVEHAGDLVNARLTRAPSAEIVGRLETLGRLLQFMRQMDVAMKSDGAIDVLVDAFRRGDYALKGQGGGA